MVGCSPFAVTKDTKTKKNLANKEAFLKPQEPSNAVVFEGFQV